MVDLKDCGSNNDHGYQSIRNKVMLMRHTTERRAIILSCTFLFASCDFDLNWE